MKIYKITKKIITNMSTYLIHKTKIDGKKLYNKQDYTFKVTKE